MKFDKEEYVTLADVLNLNMLIVIIVNFLFNVFDSYIIKLYDILMNPLDQFVIEEVKEEVRRVIEKDPKVQIDEIFTQTLDHLIRVQVQLKFLPTLDEDRLFLEYARTDVEI